MATESQAAYCDCIFCAGVVAACFGTRLHGVCDCGRCCKPIQASFGITEQEEREEREDQDRIAEFVMLELSIEIELAEMNWLSWEDLKNFLAGLRCSANYFESRRTPGI